MQVVFSELTDTPSHKFQPGIVYDLPDALAVDLLRQGKCVEPPPVHAEKPAPKRRRAVKSDAGFRKSVD